jgi:FxsC-like protein
MSNETAAPAEYAFFLSYARANAKGPDGSDNVYFKQFKEDLTFFVSSALGPVAELDKDIVFYDKDSIDLGTDWDSELRRALQTSRVMVCLYSPAYFGREYCGKEFEVFRRRARAYAATLPQGAPAPAIILPVLWENPDNFAHKIPSALKAVQFTHGSLGGLYAQKGVLRLLAWQEEALYKKFVTGLADIIVQTFNEHADVKPLPQLPPLSEVLSAFHTPPEPAPGVAAPPAQVKRGVEVVWLYYFAGAKQDYAALRQKNECYGDTGRDWRPYLPDDDKMIRYTASVIATNSGVAPEPGPTDGDIIAKLRDAEDKNTIVAIIVDPWAIKLPSFQKQLFEYDRARLSNCGVVVLWNDNDIETKGERERLQKLLEQTFPNSIISQDVTFQHSVNSKEELREKLERAIKDVKQRVENRGRLLRGEGLPSVERLPTLPTAGAALAGGDQ